MKNLRSILSITIALWRFWLVVVATIAVLLLLNRYLPEHHNPAKPLTLTDPVGIATYGKLRHIRSNAKACFAALDRIGLEYLPIENEKTGQGCGFRNALSLRRLSVDYSSELRMSCPLAASLIVWESQSVVPLAEKLLDSPVEKVMSYGAYSCRNIAGSRRRSEHALANAIDIAAFKLADGRVIRVKEDWGKDTPAGEFLERIHRSSCRYFNVTLGPDYNKAHEDHFHLDLGKYHSCK